MVGLARGAQDPLQDRLLAFAALLQGVHVVVVTIGLAIEAVERLAWKKIEVAMNDLDLKCVELTLQQAPAMGADETLNVESPPHGLTTGALTHDPTLARVAQAKVLRRRGGRRRPTSDCRRCRGRWRLDRLIKRF